MTYQLDNLQKVLNIVKQTAKASFRQASSVQLVLDVRGFEIAEINHLIGAGIKYLAVGKNFSLEDRKKIVNPVKYRLLESFNPEETSRVYDDYELIETIEDLEEVRRIAVYGVRTGKTVFGLIKVDLIGKSGNYGVYPQNLDDFIRSCKAYSGVKLKGLTVTFPPFNNREIAELSFRKLLGLQQFLRLKHRMLKILSVNVNSFSDLELAVRYGATEIRIGKMILENN